MRRFVLATSFPPLLQLYRAVYGVVAHAAVRMFRRYGEVRSIYMRRGGARGDILPLVSDIDFAVITGPMAAADRDDLYDEYASLVRRTTLLDKSLELYTEEEFFDVFERDDYARLRFTEGKRSWRLVHGRDYVRELPDLPPDKLAGGFITEIKVWWALFGWRFFHARKYNDETVTRNNVCYKTVGEVLRMDLALRGAGLAASREEAFHKAIAALPEGSRDFVRSVAAIPASRYRRRRETIVAETMDFLLDHLVPLYDRLRSHPLAAPLGEAGHVVDFDRSESHRGRREQALVERIAAHVREKWRCGVRAVRVTPGSYFNLDELLLMIETDGGRPTVEEITRLNGMLDEEPALLRGRIRIFLLYPGAAFQIDPDDLMKSWQTVLFPPANPDIFELLGSEEALVFGDGGGAPESAPPWTPLARHFFREEKALFYELLDDPAVYKLCGLDFCRIFWKTAQLVILNRSADRGTILYPMTPPAVTRALSAEGAAVPDTLLALDPIYREELRGAARDVGEFIPDAIDYLKEIR